MKNKLTSGFDAQIIQSLIKKIQKDTLYENYKSHLLTTLKEIEICFSYCKNINHSKANLFFYILSNLVYYEQIKTSEIIESIKSLTDAVQVIEHAKPIAIRVNQLIEKLIIINPEIVPGLILDKFYTDRERDLRN